MGAYGNLLNAFPELMRTISVWTNSDKSDMRKIRGIFMPTKGDSLQYQKYSNRGKAIQYFADDRLFVGRGFIDKVDIGDYFYDPNDRYIYRIVGKADLVFSAGYTCFTTARLTGSTVDHTEKLTVKEAQFD
jgi:hypothetical protein